jgi:phage shock protein PspC (stress-responsive transcriptional regulator)/predicted membrane protein
MSEYTTPTPLVKRLERSSDAKILAGVAGGLGRYFDLAPAVFRLGFVVLTLLGGAGVLVYIAAVLVMPKEGEEFSIAEDILRKRREHPARVVALGLIAVVVLSALVREDSWPSAGAAWFLVLVAGVILLWTSRRRGIVLALTTFLALIVATAFAAVAVAFAWFDVSFHDGIGDRTETPASIADVPSRYELGIGKLNVDLSHLPAGQPVQVKAHVGLGRLEIDVPRNAKVALTTHVKAGDIDAFGIHDDGRNAKVNTGNGVMRIDAQVGAGHIEVVRVP